MPPPGLSAAVARARRAVAPDPRTDGALLAAFVAARDGEAFAALVERFGPMVFAVCRRATGHHQDAEDAFQAVFVVLARKAAAVVPREAVGGWLYGVAVRTAREARTMAARRAAREAPSSHLPDAAGGAAHPEPDLAAVIDAELAALPEKDRALLVRCDLRDESQVAVAAALGVPVGTVYSRLAAARKRLAARLTARGVAPGAGGLAVALGEAARATVPADLPARAVAAALTPEHAPAAVAALSHGVLRAMFLHKLRLAPLALAAVASAALAAGLLTAQPTPPAPPAPAPAGAQPGTKAAARPVLKAPNRILVTLNRAILLIDPDGKSQQRLTSFEPDAGMAFDAKLSPDGTRVAVVRAVASEPGEQVVRRSLFVFPVNREGEPEDLKVDGEIAFWSSDGTELLVARADGRARGKDRPNFQHQLVNATTGRATAVKLPSDHIVTSWLADGRFVTTRLGGTPDDLTARVFLMNRDGTESKAVTDAKVIIAGGSASPDGTRMLGQRPVFKAGQGNRGEAEREDLVLIDVATGRVTPVEVPPNGALHGYCWSPDGKRIAYTWRQQHKGTPDQLARTETESRLIVADPDGKNARTVLTAKGPSQWTITLGAPDWR
ncbi:MAG: sigma-70 family RNA polymerase sigma factor [Gemmataceae bacterium]